MTKVSSLVINQLLCNNSNNVGVMVFSNEEDTELENIVSLLFNYGEKQ